MMEELEKKRKPKQEEIDRNSLNPRLTEELLIEGLLLRFNFNQCKNRGYVLDGYPRGYENAKNLFLKI